MTEIQQLEKTLKDVQERLEALKNPRHAFEAGKWYINIKTNLFIFKYKEGGSNMFGLNNDRNWSERLSCNNSDIGEFYRPATQSEIEAALIAEAKRRGFKKNQRLSKPLCSVNTNGSGESYSYSNDNDMLQLNGTAVYHKGNWAEIITEPKIEIGGYKVKFIEEYGSKWAKIGCKQFSKKELIPIYDFMVTFDFMHTSFDSYKVDRDTINKILAKL